MNAGWAWGVSFGLELGDDEVGLLAVVTVVEPRSDVVSVESDVSFSFSFVVVVSTAAAASAAFGFDADADADPFDRSLLDGALAQTPINQFTGVTQLELSAQTSSLLPQLGHAGRRPEHV